MAFKLNRYKSLPGIATAGEINKKFNFKIKHKDLEEGINAEAVSANEIIIDKDIPKDSDLYKEAVAHEALHAEEMEKGVIDYGDDWVRDGDKTYHRKDGKIKYNGTWYPEGHEVLPWEKRAMENEVNGDDYV